MERVRAMTDPYPMMEKFAREKQTILEFVSASQETEQLRRVVAEREAELAGLKNQEVTIANLREELDEAQHERAEAVQQSAADTSHEWEGILRGYQQREASAAQELAQVQQESVRWRLLQQGSSEQLISLRSKLEDVEAAREREIAGLVEELDEANTQVALKDSEIGRLLASLTSLQSERGAMSPESGGAPTPSRTSTKAANMMLEEHVSELERALAKVEALRQHDQAQASSDREAICQEHAAALRNLEKEAEDRTDTLSAQLDAARNEIVSQKAFAKGLQDELHRTQNSVRLVEADLQQKERLLQSEAKPREGLPSSDGLPIAASSPIVSDITTFTPADASNPVELEDTFVALASQRDRLRQRLLALEEASSQEIHRLQMEVQSLKMDRSTATLSVLATNAEHDTESARRPLLIFRHGKLNVTTESVVEVLDRGNMLMGRFILSNLQWRRGFVAYLLLLHTYIVLSTLLSVFFG
ncbi:transmembrane protein, putative [Bodo saltans]|uniref:Transmembrane protein, putative n=1 Tax=Bodo saltans TaxID=75058 RepID=A0A0S4IXD5_BODSA|nr:transmembrane protein, putative [Bodo saltans]|eukprot:CUG06410.1 transmembrane protein, putative [Bodo saltans]